MTEYVQLPLVPSSPAPIYVQQMRKKTYKATWVVVLGYLYRQRDKQSRSISLSMIAASFIIIHIQVLFQLLLLLRII
jgi:hypothetical protein